MLKERQRIGALFKFHITWENCNKGSNSRTACTCVLEKKHKHTSSQQQKKSGLFSLMHCTKTQMHFHLELNLVLAQVIIDQCKPLRNYHHCTFCASFSFSYCIAKQNSQWSNYHLQFSTSKPARVNSMFGTSLCNPLQRHTKSIINITHKQDMPWP